MEDKSCQLSALQAECCSVHEVSNSNKDDGTVQEGHRQEYDKGLRMAKEIRIPTASCFVVEPCQSSSWRTRFPLMLNFVKSVLAVPAPQRLATALLLATKSALPLDSILGYGPCQEGGSG